VTNQAVRRFNRSRINDSEKQKPSPSGKSENEGIQRIPNRTSGRAGLILLFAEKRSETLGADEHSQTVILTSDFKPCSRLPIRSWR
jgi:hypothetical protein